MALISAHPDDEPRNHNLYADARYQRFLAHLESTVRGEPGGPVTEPEPFIPVGETELVDGIPPAPEPPRPPRRKRPKRRPVPEDFPTGDRELKALARKLTGRH
jgi:hypothetical protein